MPAEQRLRTGQQGSPRWPGHDAADRGQEEAIGRLPARPAGLPFQYSQLIAQSQDFSSKPGVRPVAVDQGVDQEAGEGVEEGVEHDPASVSGSGRSRLSSEQVPLSPYNRQPKVNGKRDSELTECAVTGQSELALRFTLAPCCQLCSSHMPRYYTAKCHCHEFPALPILRPQTVKIPPGTKGIRCKTGAVAQL